MRTKEIIYFGKKALVQCDGNCQKAWGVHSRPNNKSDEELGIAPEDPRTYEGGFAKPKEGEEMNKWCVRECERSRLIDR